MSEFRLTITIILIAVGSAFMLLASIGLIRMPDLFTRMQAATKAATLGSGCMVFAAAVYFASLGVATRALLVITFFFLTAPVAAHMIGRAAYSVGVPLWDRTVVDDLRPVYRRRSGPAGLDDLDDPAGEPARKDDPEPR